MNAYRSIPLRRCPPRIGWISHFGFRPTGLRLAALSRAMPVLALFGLAVLAPGCGPGSSGEPLETIAGDLTLTDHIDEFHDGDQDISHYTCSMHPSVEQSEPGTCPICSMTLVPVSRREVETGIITIDAEQRRTIGVHTAPVTLRSATVRIRAVGRVTFDESRMTGVTTRYRGWVRGLSVDRTGQYVERGQILFKLYSPELYAAQEELLAALASQEAARRTQAPERADYLVAAARKRLRLWDIETEQIDRIVAGGQPIEFLPVVSPTSGYVVEKEIVDGDAIEPGRRLYRIAALDRVWVEADVYEAQLPLIAVGQSAEITLPYQPGRKFRGRVSFVYPYLNAASRTGRVRIELPNPELLLKPEMYANVELLIDRGEQLLVPESAVLYAGPRRLVFVDLGGGRLRPQEVEIGVRSDDAYEILSGLEPGDEVVVSGNFLVAAESRLKSATENW